jgi:peptide/nickel transport system permease protein
MTATSIGSTPASAKISAEERKATLSVRQLMVLRFRRSKLAVFGAIVLAIMYTAMIFAGFVSPYTATTTHERYVSAPPFWPKFIDAEGQFHLRPFMYGITSTTDRATFKKVYVEDTSEMYPVYFFQHGLPYQLLGFIETDIHLFQVDEPGKIFLFGTDRNGRDELSRIMYGSQVSLTIGLVGVMISLAIGAFLGVASGYYGGAIDNITQRTIEIIQSIPQIPLWLALAAAVPATWDPMQVYFGIIIVLSLVTWGGLARQVRGITLSLRESDFVTAARYTNCRTRRILSKHLLPNTYSHLLVIATLAIPSMILGETALSFLGLGIRPPMVSWGVLLNEAQQVRVLLQNPWLLTPIAFVLITVVSYNFVGDGLRDAADPFAGE